METESLYSCFESRDDTRLRTQEPANHAVLIAGIIVVVSCFSFSLTSGYRSLCQRRMWPLLRRLASLGGTRVSLAH